MLRMAQVGTSLTRVMILSTFPQGPMGHMEANKQRSSITVHFWRQVAWVDRTSLSAR